MDIKRFPVTACFCSNKDVRPVICYVVLCPHCHTIEIKTTSTTTGAI